jgi:hypothetical protein
MAAWWLCHRPTAPLSPDERNDFDETNTSPIPPHYGGLLTKLELTPIMGVLWK